MKGMMHFQFFFKESLYLFIILARISSGQDTSLKIVSVVDKSLGPAREWLESAVLAAQTESGVTIEHQILILDIEDELGAEEKFCQAAFSGVSLLLDVTGGGWGYGRQKAAESGLPYVHILASNYQWMSAADQILQFRNATDAALIFNDNAQLDQALYYLVEGSVVRVIVLSGIAAQSTETIKKMRPAPQHFVMFGPTSELSTMFAKAVGNDLVTRDSRWTILALDVSSSPFQTSLVPGSISVTLFTPKETICCTAMGKSSPCSCAGANIPKELTINALKMSVKALKSSNVQRVSFDCEAELTAVSTKEFYSALEKTLRDWRGVEWKSDKKRIVPQLSLDISTVNATTNEKVGQWSSARGLQLDSKFKSEPIMRFFRVGTMKSRPWMYQKDTPGSSPPSTHYEGYCLELTKKLSEIMMFNYEFVFPNDSRYGSRKEDGSWNGMVGDLAKGETDIIVAPLTMTSEREEVVDFVAPYFDQSGISIVIRKRQREESLFKFMTVLKTEVWVSIVAALVITGIMIWFLDKHSPYSAQNDQASQGTEYRKFTLKESFWFALTSFTPQGGGEAPRALSGRTLVAAYWLFVVLMLATFTANLAAFLTVERMQSPVQSLEALARQSKINFTTVSDISVYEYFANMARAEDELFRVWKELTLNSTTDQSRYRVWDYPIKEQYTHIKQVIDETGPLSNVDDGLKKVLDSQEGEFAFIHDSSELRYEVYHNCFLTEVGEPFAEQPYAVAVQQGSHLQVEISKAILELQKDRYFEALTAKFWNSSSRGQCENDNDSEGITLQSLGGVFIATLFGLALALIALAVEVMYYRRLPENHEDSHTPRKQPIWGPNIKSSKISVSPVY